MNELPAEEHAPILLRRHPSIIIRSCGGSPPCPPTAEITAAETRAEIEALKKTNPAEYRRLTNDPMAVVEKFWRKQMEKEGVGHENNQRPIPKGTRYGLYDFAPVLRSLGYGVTQEHLKQWRQKNVGGH